MYGIINTNYKHVLNEHAVALTRYKKNNLLLMNPHAVNKKVKEEGSAISLLTFFQTQTFTKVMILAKNNS
jgi:uncharacterized protein YvpB